MYPSSLMLELVLFFVYLFGSSGFIALFFFVRIYLNYSFTIGLNFWTH